jgi:hypothetical protein
VKTKTMYMHTLRGEPGHFVQGQICYAKNGTALSELLVGSLREIRRQQQDSIRFRRLRGFDSDVNEYSYLRVKVNP